VQTDEFNPFVIFIKSQNYASFLIPGQKQKLEREKFPRPMTPSSGLKKYSISKSMLEVRVSKHSKIGCIPIAAIA